MKFNLKTYFQDIHYSRVKPNIVLKLCLYTGEFFYGNAISLKNLLYKKGILKEKRVDAYVICVGNLTTGGVGKTPITIKLANEYSKDKKVAVISRGYGSKLNTKIPQIIKDFDGIKFQNGTICGDEPFETAKKVGNNTVVIICKDRYKACKTAIEKYNSEIIIMDDGFSNRKVKKDKTILVFDSKMKFGNGHMLPFGPLREDREEVKRCDEIYIVNKDDVDIGASINEFKTYSKKMYVCEMKPKRIYNSLTNAEVKINNEEKSKVVAFCAIGQPVQFYNFLKSYYEVITYSFSDHHKYTKNDIEHLIKLANKNNTSTFVTTQKDETKIKKYIADYTGYSFNILELESIIKEV